MSPPGAVARKHPESDDPYMAGTYAPTAMNAQPWRFVVVKNRRLIREYDERAKKLFVAAFKDTTIPALAGYVRNLSKPEVRLFYGAPVLILVFACPEVVEEYDCALAAENMMLAAHSLGIGEDKESPNIRRWAEIINS
jgi:nitroreductase